MNGHVGVLISVADREVGASVTSNLDLLPGAPASFLLAGNDVAVGSTGHAGVQCRIQVPEGREKQLTAAVDRLISVVGYID